MRFTKLNYCQYLLSSQINYTLTNKAEHLQSLSHDQINRYLRREKLTPRLVWENVKCLIQIDGNAHIIFDDTLLDKRYSEEIELTRRQYSGKSWTKIELEQGKIVKIKTFPKPKKVKLFRVIVSTDKTEYVATNDLNQDSTDVVQQVCDIRWKIEEFHRELLAKRARVCAGQQLTGIEACQCRKARIQRNHINCAIQVLLRLKDLAYQTGQTVYKLNYGLLSNYLIAQLKRPTHPMSLV